jgi:galactokinase/mevalonate kinase-like predicted kinase
MVAPVRRYLSAWELPGAGGGGFLFMVAHDEEAAAAVRRTLAARPPNPLARLFRFQLDTGGLRQTVL